MKLTLIALSAVAMLSPALADAQTAPAEAPKTEAAAASPLTGNISLVSDYRFRGISQTFKQPAIQGGFDYAHESGFYVGNWNSSVSGNQFPNGGGIEMDFYGGYKFPVGGDITLDIGLLQYYYPGAFYNGFTGKPKYDNLEVYFGASMGPFSGKVYYALSDFFGLSSTVGGSGSKGSYYIDLGYTGEIFAKTTLVAHVGYQSVKNYGDLSYWDYKIGVNYDIYNGFMLGAAIVGTNADKNLYYAVDSSGRTKTLGDTTVVFSLSKTF